MADCKFTVTDKSGKNRNYTFQPHLPDDALDISLALAALGLGGLAGAENLAKAMKDDSAKALIKLILSTCIRDGKQLADPVEWNAAFQMNTSEIYKACFEVIKESDFLPLDIILKTMDKLQTKNPAL